MFKFFYQNFASSSIPGEQPEFDQAQTLVDSIKDSNCHILFGSEKLCERKRYEMRRMIFGIVAIIDSDPFHLPKRFLSHLKRLGNVLVTMT
jgi:hypothetical protein